MSLRSVMKNLGHWVLLEFLFPVELLLICSTCIVWRIYHYYVCSIVDFFLLLWCLIAICLPFFRYLSIAYSRLMIGLTYGVLILIFFFVILNLDDFCNSVWFCYLLDLQRNDIIMLYSQMRAKYCCNRLFWIVVLGW